MKKKDRIILHVQNLSPHLQIRCGIASNHAKNHSFFKPQNSPRIRLEYLWGKRGKKDDLRSNLGSRDAMGEGSRGDVAHLPIPELDDPAAEDPASLANPSHLLSLLLSLPPNVRRKARESDRRNCSRRRSNRRDDRIGSDRPAEALGSGGTIRKRWLSAD